MTIHRCPSPSVFPRVALHAAPILAAVAAATVLSMSPIQAGAAADDSAVQRLATCQDSWDDWKEGDPRLRQYTAFIASHLAEADGAAFTPTAPMTAFALPVTVVYPQSVGTGVGFSLLVGADLAQVRRIFEARLGRSMTCSTSDGTPACELKVGPKKTVVLVSDGPRGKATLAGCYYFYQQ